MSESVKNTNKTLDSKKKTFLDEYSSFEVHRNVPDGVEPSDLVEALVRAAPTYKRGNVPENEAGSVGRVVRGAWNIRISLQKGKRGQNALYEVGFEALYLRILMFVVGAGMFSFFSGTLYVVDVLSGMRSGGVDISSSFAQFIAWSVVILLKFLIPVLLVTIAMAPNIVGRKDIEKIY